MGAPKEIFVDTTAWVAMEDAADPACETTLEESRRLLGEGYHLVTTNFVLDEAYTILKSHMGHAASMRFGEKIRTSTLISVVIVSPAMEDEAWRAFEHDTDSTATYTDFVSWAVMRRRNVELALTCDRNFLLAGFEIFPKPERDETDPADENLLDLEPDI
jgi:predicted nucleic acid-binding protein